MTIPLAQLKTWSGQGSVTQSKNTYATVKSALEDVDAPYKSRNFKVFLQGSYGNDTNIYSESDVDVIIRYDGEFYYDVKQTAENEQAAFHAAYPDSNTYAYKDFKEHVVQALRNKFGDSVKPGAKAIKIESNGNRRNADVIVAFEFRRYFHFKSLYNENHVAGMCFFDSGGNRIANYPKQHCENLTTKHQAAGNNLKPLIRIFKNMRSKMIEEGLIAKGSAPSYYVEGLLYNIPTDQFSGDFQDTTLRVLQWLNKTTDRSEFLCANEQYYLLRENLPTCWSCADGANFIAAASKLWDDWYG
jgi:hypothetical protein